MGSSLEASQVAAAFPDRLKIVDVAEADVCVAGAGAGVPETLDALQAGKPLVLAGNHLMITAGEELAVFRSMIIPGEPTVSAVWQSLRGEPSVVKRLVLSASDGLATLGVQAITAHHLFEIPYERMEAVSHAQGVVQAMVEFEDGSVKAVFAEADPRRALQHALSYPERWDGGDTTPVDLVKIGRLSFEPVACLEEAIAAARACYSETPKPITRGVT